MRGVVSEIAHVIALVIAEAREFTVSEVGVPPISEGGGRYAASFSLKASQLVLVKLNG